LSPEKRRENRLTINCKYVSFNENLVWMLDCEWYLQMQHRFGNPYIIKDFHFSWFDGWNGFTPLRFNQYKENKKMAEHCDHIIINEAGTRKGIPVLSIIGSLNDDYEGGEFIMFQDEEIKLKQGDLMIFPSVFLYPHRVEPVTKGVRNTFVSWAW
jgi:predicted 2-oxoglutarate/Fe(II)-dependent dioxygenase YbiX